jgi:DNA-binding CsgD family transcriptional regulator
MLAFDHETIELLVSKRRLHEAAALLVASRAENSEAAVRFAGLHAGVAAICGDESVLATTVEPELIACRTRADVMAYHGTLSGVGFHEDLAAGIVLTWSADAQGAYGLLQQAHSRAVSEERFHFAVAALERLAHHALLFGDVEIARNAIEEATRIAAAHRLSEWLLCCLTVTARLALDAGDVDAAGALLDRAILEARSPAMPTLCAPIGAQIAVEKGDGAALDLWTGPAIVATALHSAVVELAIAATLALLIATGVAGGDSQARTALRRSLLVADGAATCPELFSMAARYGDLDEACLGTRALGAVFASDRPYLHAHRLLARAYLAFRYGNRAAWADHASDAARAFNAMGLRRWTNEAMLLLVRQSGGGARQPGQGRHTNATLTEREQQVADLIRRGARNREVALTLQISEHTVERHVSSILGRLGLRSRWQIADTQKNDER